MQYLLKFPGMIIMLYLNKVFYTVYMPEKSDIVLKFIMHNLGNRGRAVISAHVTRYISNFFHVPLNLFDRISEGNMCLPEGRLFLLLGVSKDTESLSTLFAII